MMESRRLLNFYLTAYTVCNTVCYVQCTGYRMTIADNLFENLRLELRRGCLTLAVLAQLREEHYGYTLRKALAERGLEIDESTLYPLLRRLETQGLLASEWREEDKRNKRFYRLSSDGEQMFTQLLQEWNAINASINNIL
jgi:PadR family transcriptional regulator, regulatory protein PadR